MVILSDWNQGLEAYSIPEDLIKNINSLFSESHFAFKDDVFDVDEVFSYFGNIPDESTLSRFPNLQWVHFGSIGIDKISTRFIEENALTVTNGAKTNNSAVVTFCMGELFRSCKAGFLSRNPEKTEFTREHYNNFYDHMIDYSDIELTILGYGSIGKELATVLSPIIKNINIVTKTKRENYKNIKFFSLNEISDAIKESTHLINVLPLHKETFEILNKKTLKNINSTYYICAGRAETHVIEEIIKFIDLGNIRGASIDVHGLPNGQIQEIDLKHGMLNLYPHISGWTKNFWNNHKEIIIHNIKMFNADCHEDMKNLIYKKGKIFNGKT